MNKINYMKKYVVQVLIVVGFLLVILKQNRTITKMELDVKPTSDSLLILNNTIDSLESEMFIKDIDLERLEYILGRAQAEMSPECKQELEIILSQTE